MRHSEVGQCQETTSIGAMELGVRGMSGELHPILPHTHVRKQGQFRETTSMGAMEWGVTGGSVPTAAANQEKRHHVARAHGSVPGHYFHEGHGMGGGEAHVVGSSVSKDVAVREAGHRARRANVRATTL